MNRTSIGGPRRFHGIALAAFCCVIAVAANGKCQSVEPPPVQSRAMEVRRLEVERDALTAILQRMRAAESEQIEVVKQQEAQALAIRQERDRVQNALDEQGVSEASFGDVVRLLQTQRVALTIDLAGLHARREALLKAQEAWQQSQEAPVDSVIGLLNSLVSLHRENLAHAERLMRQGGASQVELTRAKRELVEVELRLIEFRERQGAGPAQGQLADIVLELAEKSARLESIEQMLREYRALRESIGSSARLEHEWEHLQINLAERRRALEKIRAELMDHELQLERLNAVVKQLRDDQ